jgi:phosphohistidine phosphatase SixA
MHVYVVRHGEAAPGEPDELRRLTPNGREQARRLRAELGTSFDAVLSSPLLRARETAELVAGRTPEPDERLAPGATADDVRAAVAGRGDRVLVVGHEPDCGRIVAALTGEQVRSFRPCGHAVVEL